MQKIMTASLLALTLAGCSAADQMADQATNIAENSAAAIGAATEQSGAILANGISDVGNAIEPKPQVATDDWVGRWIGVEGTYLAIAKAAGTGKYTLEMQYTLDDKGTFDGTSTADGIAFTRPDGAKTLRATDGGATGLKYLEGKKDCLTVASGEGYCRD
jgi:hypothetical protein